MSRGAGRFFRTVEKPAKKADAEVDREGVPEADALGHHHPEKSAVGLVAVEADGVEVVVHKRGRPGATFEGGENDGQPGDGIKIGTEATGDRKSIEFVGFDKLPKAIIDRLDGRGGEEKALAGAVHYFGKRITEQPARIEPQRGGRRPRPRDYQRMKK